MKKYSLKFWLTFWLTAIVFLVSWFFYWELKNNKEYNSLATLGYSAVFTHGQTKTYLILFQNNLEIRPGGGFLGAFGIIKIRNGKIISMETQDLANFDAQVPNTLPPPYPMQALGYADFWKMRDSNFSPDFATNAQNALRFYYLGGGQQQFDGVIGITANTLSSMLKATGPVQIDGYPGTYDSENAIISLEYQVEQAFVDQGIDKGQRKDVIKILATEIEKRILNLSLFQKAKLADILLNDLKSKDIQLYFKDPGLEKISQSANWAGAVDSSWQQDYLMTSDANIGAFKSDYYVKRSIDYTVDLSQEKPAADVKITYTHTAKQKDWMTRDYLTYLRVYVPSGSTYESGTNFDNVQSGNEFGKQYFGAIVKVPIAASKTVELKYDLPDSISAKNYSLEIQKQAGLDNIPVAVHVISKDGTTKNYSYTMDSDIVL